MFCDGIRPGSDLTNLDTDFNYSENQKSEKAKKSGKTGRGPVSLDAETKSFIPRDESGLPPTVTIFKTGTTFESIARKVFNLFMISRYQVFPLHEQFERRGDAEERAFNFCPPVERVRPRQNH